MFERGALTSLGCHTSRGTCSRQPHAGQFDYAGRITKGGRGATAQTGQALAYG